MIAYYAHQHGYGHSNFANLFCQQYKYNSLIITSSDFRFSDELKVIKIKNEDCDSIEYNKTTYNLPGYAHYLPKLKNELLYRNLEILSASVLNNINFVFIDVSVETAIQFRIAGIPYAYCLMFGDRSDLPHIHAYQGAEFLFAYYPRELEQERSELEDKQILYTGFISRFQYQLNKKSFEDIDIKKNFSVLIITGNGGTVLTKSKIENLAIQIPPANIMVIGNKTIYGNSKYFKCIEFTSKIENAILESDVIIASCGMNLTSEILALKNKFIAVIEGRPFREQEFFSKSLIRENLVVPLKFGDFSTTMYEYNHLKRNEKLKSFFGSMQEFRSMEDKFIL